jgi:hypothetical protein
MRFVRSLSHILDMLPPGIQGFIDLKDMVEVLSPVFDVFGTARFKEVQHEAGSGSAASNLVDMSSTPAGKVRYVFAAQVTHDDAGTKTLGWHMVSNIGAIPNAIMVHGSQVAVASGFLCGLPRTVIVPAGWNLRAISQEAIGAGKVLTFGAHFIDVPIGEYIQFPA